MILKFTQSIFRLRVVRVRPVKVKGQQSPVSMAPFVKSYDL